MSLVCQNYCFGLSEQSSVLGHLSELLLWPSVRTVYCLGSSVRITVLLGENTLCLGPGSERRSVCWLHHTDKAVFLEKGVGGRGSGVKLGVAGEGSIVGRIISKRSSASQRVSEPRE